MSAPSQQQPESVNRPRKSHAAPRHDTKAPTAREVDLRELLEYVEKRDQRVASALVTVLRHGDARVLAALGVIVDFAVSEAAVRSR